MEALAEFDPTDEDVPTKDEDVATPVRGIVTSKSSEAKKQTYIASSDYGLPKPRLINSLIPKGRSILASGGGLSNTPVEYTNSRSFMNVYKNKGSLAGFGLIEKIRGSGLAKGESVLDSGRGVLFGNSLFKIKHYDPLEIKVDTNSITAAPKVYVDDDDDDDDDYGDDDDD